jgi:hypothetical protein
VRFNNFRGMLVRFWRSDPGLSAFLALLILSVLVLEPLSGDWAYGKITFDVAFSMLLFGGIAAASEQPWVLLLTTLVIAITILLHGTLMIMPSHTIAVWHALFVSLSFGIMALVMLVQVFREGPVTHHRIQGAIAVYLLLGLALAGVYELIDLTHQGAFTGTFGGAKVTTSWLYYSFVTLTTLGYGDIVPVHSLARSMAVMEALVGQLFPAILIARLVSQEVHERNKRD